MVLQTLGDRTTPQSDIIVTLAYKIGLQCAAHCEVITLAQVLRSTGFSNQPTILTAPDRLSATSRDLQNSRLTC